MYFSELIKEKRGAKTTEFIGDGKVLEGKLTIQNYYPGRTLELSNKLSKKIKTERQKLLEV